MEQNILFILISENNLLEIINVVKKFLNKNLSGSKLLIIDNSSDKEMISDLMNCKKGENIEIKLFFEKSNKSELVNFGINYGIDDNFDFFSILNSSYETLFNNLALFRNNQCDFSFCSSVIPKLNTRNIFEDFKEISKSSGYLHDEMIFLMSKNLINKNNLFSNKMINYNDAFNEYIYRLLLNEKISKQQINLNYKYTPQDTLIKIYDIILNWDFCIFFFKNTFWSISEKKNNYYSLDFKYIKIITTKENIIDYNEDNNILAINNQYLDLLFNYYKFKTNVFIVFDTSNDLNFYLQTKNNMPHAKTIYLNSKNENENENYSESDYVIENLNELNDIIKNETKILFVSQNNKYDNYTNIVKNELLFDFCYYDNIQNMINNKFDIDKLSFYDIIIWQNITENIPEKKEGQIYYHIIHDKEPILELTFLDNYKFIDHHIFVSENIKNFYEKTFEINIKSCDLKININKNTDLHFSIKNDYIVPNNNFHSKTKIKGNIFCYTKTTDGTILATGNKNGLYCKIYFCKQNYNKIDLQLIKEYKFYDLRCMNMEFDSNNDLILYIGDKDNIKLFRYDIVNKEWDKNYFILYHNDSKIEKININPENKIINVWDSNENKKSLCHNYQMLRLDLIHSTQ